MQNFKISQLIENHNLGKKENIFSKLNNCIEKVELNKMNEEIFINNNAYKKLFQMN
jgi:hypothetical protein